MLKRLLPIALVIVLLFSSVAFAGGQGSGKVSEPKGEPKTEAKMEPKMEEKMGAGCGGEMMPENPWDDDEWTPFTYCYGYGYGYGYAYANDCFVTDGSCICTDGSCLCSEASCEFFFQHQWRMPWVCPVCPDEPDEVVVPVIEP